MEKKRLRALVYAFLVSFLLIDIVFALYIFNSTVRYNEPDWIFHSEGDILSSDYSGTGDAFVYGTGSSIYFHYFFNPKASRSYTLDSVVKKVVVSNNKKYVAASDLEN
ncbi:MAG: hypothetical protein ACXQTP_06215, partial [Candidatus Methanofastidiosia archaeon]